jgi:CRISPR/Cas system CSM-associated protein Csm3 (group 7 of RAMP superfamily)
MIVHRVEGILTALSPVFQGGNEKTGSTVLLNRLKFIVDNRSIDVPIISGNSVRGRLRRLITRDFLEKVGYTMDLSQKSYQKLYHTLFAGGVLTSAEEESASGTIDLSLKSKLIKYVLPLRLFGASYSNQMIEGRILVGHMLPVCKELKDYTGVDSDISFYQLITRAFQTRRDELRTSSNKGEEDEEDDETVQMIIDYECFAPGTKFYHEIVLITTAESEALDLSTLYRTIELWIQAPTIGGKSSVGFGKLKIEYKWPKDVGDKPYLEFIDKNREEIIKALDELRGAL